MRRKKGTVSDPCSYNSENVRQLLGNGGLVAPLLSELPMHRQVSPVKSLYRAGFPRAGALARALTHTDFRAIELHTQALPAKNRI